VDGDAASVLERSERIEKAFASDLTKVLNSIISVQLSGDEATTPGSVFGDSGILADFLRSSSSTLSGLIRAADSDGRAVSEGVLSELQVWNLSRCEPYSVTAHFWIRLGHGFGGMCETFCCAVPITVSLWFNSLLLPSICFG
jgi:hypothetical protein